MNAEARRAENGRQSKGGPALTAPACDGGRSAAAREWPWRRARPARSRRPSPASARRDCVPSRSSPAARLGALARAAVAELAAACPGRMAVGDVSVNLLGALVLAWLRRAWPRWSRPRATGAFCWDRVLRRVHDVLDVPGRDDPSRARRPPGPRRGLRAASIAGGMASRSQRPSRRGGAGTDEPRAALDRRGRLRRVGSRLASRLAAVLARRPSDFPLGTFVVNLTGGFLLGLLTGLSVTGDALLVFGPGCSAATRRSRRGWSRPERLGEDAEWALMWAYLLGSMAAGLASRRARVADRWGDRMIATRSSFRLLRRLAYRRTAAGKRRADGQLRRPPPGDSDLLRGIEGSGSTGASMPSASRRLDGPPAARVAGDARERIRAVLDDVDATVPRGLVTLEPTRLATATKSARPSSRPARECGEAYDLRRRRRARGSAARVSRRRGRCCATAARAGRPCCPGSTGCSAARAGAHGCSRPMRAPR